jgi:hypothetical protein
MCGCRIKRVGCGVSSLSLGLSLSRFTSLDCFMDLLQQPGKFGCGRFTVLGPIEGSLTKCGHKRLLCDCLRCERCRPRRLRIMRARIAEQATKHGLTRLATLTLDPKKLPAGVRSDRYLRNCWRKMRVLLERRFGRTVHFISVLEFQESGMAHLHVLFGVFIPQEWLSEAWQSVGGGEIVDIRYVEIRKVAAYLTTYLTSAKITNTLGLLPRRARIFSTSRGIRLSKPSGNSGWWLKRKHITYLHFHSPNATEQRYETLDVGSRPVLVSYQAPISTEDARNLGALNILGRLVKAEDQNGR